MGLDAADEKFAMTKKTGKPQAPTLADLRQRRKTGTQTKPPSPARGLHPGGKAYRNWLQSARWARLEDLRNELLVTKDPFKRSLKITWDTIKRQDDLPPELLGVGSPVEALVLAVRLGRYPSAELLLSVVESLDDYFIEGGSISLEEALIAKPTRKGGNLAAQRNNQMMYHAIARLLFAIRREHPEITSNDDAAALAIEKYGIAIDIPSLVRMAALGKLKTIEAGKSSPSADTAAHTAAWHIALKQRRKRKNKPVIVHRGTR